MPLLHRLIRTTALALALACAAAPHPSAAQRLPLAFEARGGIALPMEEFGGAEGGASAEVSATWHALPFIGLYGAYQWNRFAWDGTGGHATDSGIAAGVRINIPTPLFPIDPWVRAGVVAHQLHAETIDEQSRRGYEAGGGLAFPLARGATLTPAVTWTRYRHGSGAADGELLQVHHFRADVGVRLRL